MMTDNDSNYSVHTDNVSQNHNDSGLKLDDTKEFGNEETKTNSVSTSRDDGVPVPEMMSSCESYDGWVFKDLI